jgi:hypothetical protein
MLFFVKEYPTNKTLNTANKILIKKQNKSNFPENILCIIKQKCLCNYVINISSFLIFML